MNAQIVFAPNNGCSASDYAGASGKIVLTDRGGGIVCNGFDFDSKARLAEAAGATGLLVGNTSAGQLFFSPDAGQPVDAGVTIPVVLVRSAAASAIKAAITGGETVNGPSPTVPIPGGRFASSIRRRRTPCRRRSSTLRTRTP